MLYIFIYHSKTFNDPIDKRPKNNDVDTDNNDTLPVDSGSRQAHLARPPSSAQIKQKRKLTDLREKSQSEESEEYHASSQDEDDDPEPSDREYLPSERSR